MAASRETRASTDVAPDLDFDAIIIGAGMSGMYQLLPVARARHARCACSRPAPASAAPGTGTAIRAPASIPRATPTAIPSRRSCCEEWNWKEHFAGQPENAALSQSCRRQVRPAPRHRSSAAGSRRRTSTRRPDSWNVTLQDGSALPRRFLITAIGLLSAPTLPRIEGMDSFRGQSFHTARLAARAGRLRRQAGRRSSAPAPPACRPSRKIAKTRRPADGVPAHAELVRAAAQRHDLDEEMQPKSGRATTKSSGAASETFACFIHTPDPRATFEVSARGTRGVLRKALRRAAASASGWAISATC